MHTLLHQQHQHQHQLQHQHENQYRQGTASGMEVPESVMAVLPSDPEELLDLAGKITARAMWVRVARLEEEVERKRYEIAEKEKTIDGLMSRVDGLEKALADSTARLNHALDDQTKLIAEKHNLMTTVKKLNRDVAKLEVFKKTLMLSLQEEEEIPSSRFEGAEKSLNRVAGMHSSFNLNGITKDTKLLLKKSHEAGLQDEDHHSDTEDMKHGKHHSFPLTGHTPPLSPIRGSSPKRHDGGSPRRGSTSGTPGHHSPTRNPAHGMSSHHSPIQSSASGTPGHHSPIHSPLGHSLSERRMSLSSSVPINFFATAPNSPPHSSSHSSGRHSRVDGKEFFRQARNRLSYEQFSTFLATIKELNAHKQTKEETLHKADEIFGAENRDLYIAFDGLLNRHHPSH